MADDVTIENNHLYLENGDLVLVKDINRIKQQILTGLKIVKTDWVLDIDEGIAYFAGMRAYPEILSAQIKHAINTVEGGDTGLKYRLDIGHDNVFRVSATVKVGNTELEINEDINPSALGVTG